MTPNEISGYEQGLTNYDDGKDVVESALRSIDQSVKDATGTSLFHILTLGSIIGSIALYASGKRSAGIFVGLWAPTFQALKTAAEGSKQSGQR